MIRVLSGAVLGAMLVAALVVGVPRLQAQTTKYDAAYVEQATKQIQAIQDAYNSARLFAFGDKGKASEVRNHTDALGDLIAELGSTTPPVSAAGIHQQISFAAGRCQNFTIAASGVTSEDRANVFFYVMLTDLREFCAVQINAAKLRLIDYGVTAGVNPLAATD
jgi:hypothetical protein